LARHNGAFVLLSTEDPNGFEALKASLAAEHQPFTETEPILINSMAESHWLANRAQTLQDTCLDPQTGQITHPSLFSRAHPATRLLSVTSFEKKFQIPPSQARSVA
jgi:hypothetical protein